MSIVNKRLSKEFRERLDNMSFAEKDAIYRAVWFERVAEDVESYAEDNYLLTDDIISGIADAFVYEGDYDCNLDYWTNIENLINSIH